MPLKLPITTLVRKARSKAGPESFFSVDFGPLRHWVQHCWRLDIESLGSSLQPLHRSGVVLDSPFGEPLDLGSDALTTAISQNDNCARFHSMA